MDRRAILWLALSVLLTAHAGAAIAEDAARYTLMVRRADADTLPRVFIEMRLTGDADGETVLRMPDAWGGQTQLWRCIRGLSVAGAGAPTVDAVTDSARRIVRHAPSAELVVTYELFQDRPGIPWATGRNPYRPIVQPEYIHFIGNAAFIMPERADASPASFRFGAMPAGWRVASDLEHATHGRTLALGDIGQSILVAGDFRIVRRPGSHGDLRVAIRGSWTFPDSQLTDRIDSMIRAQRRFWGDEDEAFLVTMLPLGADSGSFSLGGTGLSDAFAMFATDRSELFRFDRLLAHEHLHSWIAARLGRMPEQGEAADYWLSEGFTDFYAFRLLVRDGLWTVRDYVTTVNEVLERYAQSSLRSAPNSRIVESFWSDPDAQALPYQRGFLLAWRWDAELRRVSKGRVDLDDIVLAMKRRRDAGGPGSDTLRATAALIAAMQRAGVDIRSDVARHVEAGEPIELPPDLFGSAARVVTEERERFSRGFDAIATNAAGGVVSGVEPDGPAFAAGLRDGMRIVKREGGRIGDASVPLVYRVREGETERIITYRPIGKSRFTVQRIEAPAEGDRPAMRAFEARLAGR